MLIVVSIFIFENSLMVRYRLWSAFRCQKGIFVFFCDGKRERNGFHNKKTLLTLLALGVKPRGVPYMKFR